MPEKDAGKTPFDHAKFLEKAGVNVRPLTMEDQYELIALLPQIFKEPKDLFSVISGRPEFPGSPEVYKRYDAIRPEMRVAAKELERTKKHKKTSMVRKNAVKNMTDLAVELDTLEQQILHEQGVKAFQTIADLLMRVSGSARENVTAFFASVTGSTPEEYLKYPFGTMNSVIEVMRKQPGFDAFFGGLSSLFR